MNDMVYFHTNMRLANHQVIKLFPSESPICFIEEEKIIKKSNFYYFWFFMLHDFFIRIFNGISLMSQIILISTI